MEDFTPIQETPAEVAVKKFKADQIQYTLNQVRLTQSAIFMNRELLDDGSRKIIIQGLSTILKLVTMDQESPSSSPS